MVLEWELDNWSLRMKSLSEGCRDIDECSNDGIREYHSIEFAEPCDFSSMSDSMHLDTITACSANDHSRTIDHKFTGCFVKNKMRPSVIYLFVSTLCLMTSAALAFSLAKRGCQDTCGNVTIPYPFGIGSQCYANSSFVRVVQPVSAMNCSGELKTQSLGKSLVGSPFTISALQNSLTVLGCRNSVWLRANRTTTNGGCMAICDDNSTDTSCNGINCCKITIPKGLKELQFTYQSIANKIFCGYAFLADKKWFREDYRKYNGLRSDLLDPFDQEFGNASMVLEWEYHANRFEFSHYTICEYPGDRSFSYSYLYLESLSRVCRCGFGFEGNPYLPEGCQDIDECGNSTTNFCSDRDTCVNRIGYYDCQKPKSRLKIAFIVIGSVLGAIILLLGAWRSTKLIRKRIKANRKRKFFKRNGGLLLEQQLSSTDNGLEKTKLFTSKELAHATDHYNDNRIIGRGGQGTVYKGMLVDGKIVAVKKSKRVDEDDLEIFINEVVILSQINHRNVVKLLGCCLETEVPLLVYEFIPNGTLFQHIHEPNEDFPLSWEMRMRIARDVAGALSYLHSAASAPIYHRDIKSTNILLDDKYRAKVSDFGTSRSVAIDQTHLTTRVLGTFGYLDPEYFQSSQFTEKSDVYSFGVVMVELLTGEKAISSVRAEVGKSLATHFLHSMEEDHLFDILNPRVLKEGRREEVVAIAELARRCLDLNGKKRPTMKEVAVELEGIQQLKEGSVVVQNHDNNREYHSVHEFAESYDFSSTSGSMHLDTVTACSVEMERPLLDEP
ncbi:UNVERIFIED_CONTAM: Wall-associated receptor kinase-like 8 [Sesamum calycinum]|uniref:Wall-associated receptor kinase-like 8 n=1 Tax=Sesamum calycinum TaxID=2727403 RepID=A0AAW2SW92_9LAMI